MEICLQSWLAWPTWTQWKWPAINRLILFRKVTPGGVGGWGVVTPHCFGSFHYVIRLRSVHFSLLSLEVMNSEICDLLRHQNPCLNIAPDWDYLMVLLDTKKHDLLTSHRLLRLHDWQEYFAEGRMLNGLFIAVSFTHVWLQLGFICWRRLSTL